ncbi:DUF4352 domain-containing protein [Streptomyces sp. NBC_00151]|jgi:hypothetical protein|uniref:DUF4352 domain-containing protein n=1 Tax=Streptomyces sp. NBC_00151 TaxID=2975669 RepID=UPI002DDA73F3|nr:hypothetical protein [Streptomyces sp. NBC_00151]WRZ44601.1 DUF4352 domain-containing protein [Streptomyces sp. NBC_00151]
MDQHLKVSRTGGAVVFLVLVAACSDSSDQASAGGTTSPDRPSVPSSTLSASSAVSNDTDGAPPGAKVLDTVKTGEAFTVTVLASNTVDDPARWQFTVRSVECGKPLDSAVINYTADSVGSPTPAPAPTPESGKQFCVLTMNARNVGKSEAVWDASDKVTLNVGDTRYKQSQKDSQYASDYAQYYNDKGQVGPTFGLNPGSQGPVHGVFQIPTGQKPTSIWVTSGTAIITIDGPEPGYLVLLK